MATKQAQHTPYDKLYQVGQTVRLSDGTCAIYHMPRGTRAKVVGITRQPNRVYAYRVDIEGEGVLCDQGRFNKGVWLGDLGHAEVIATG